MVKRAQALELGEPATYLGFIISYIIIKFSLLLLPSFKTGIIITLLCESVW